MANVVTLNNIKYDQPYRSEGFRAWIDAIMRNLPPATVAADAVTLYKANDLTTTAVAIKASAGKLHGIYIESLGALGYLSLWNVAQGSVTVGTTSQTLAIPFTATSGHSTAVYFAGSGNGTAPLWATAITAAVATTVTGSSAVATLPLVYIAYE